MKITLVLISIAVLAGSFVACGGNEDSADEKRCNTLCQDQGTCVDTPVPADQCTSVCASNQASTDAAGCQTEYQSLLTCTEGLADKCQATAQCAPGPGKDWATCVQRYCTTHSGTSVCP